MKCKSFFCSFFFFSCLAFWVVASPSQEEVNLSLVPKVKFQDWRLRAVYQFLGLQYKHIYSRFASDGYIFPNEKQELHFHRKLMARIALIQKQKNKNELQLKKYKKKRRRNPPLTEPQKKEWLALLERKKELEVMALRFSCRYLWKKYPKWHKKQCKK